MATAAICKLSTADGSSGRINIGKKTFGFYENWFEIVPIVKQMTNSLHKLAK